MLTDYWDWPLEPNQSPHRDRLALMREVAYELLHQIGENDYAEDADVAAPAWALSLNISPGGMLLLTDHVPEVGRVMRVHVPTPVRNTTTPTLAEVRWVRNVPYEGSSSLAFVGVKFLF